jgi:hypothetical protein
MQLGKALLTQAGKQLFPICGAQLIPEFPAFLLEKFRALGYQIIGGPAVQAPVSGNTAPQ